MTKITRTLSGHEMTHSDDAHTVAVRFLGAERTSRGYRYFAPETQRFYRIPARALAKLGAALLADEEDAYSLWCSSTSCTELSR